MTPLPPGFLDRPFAHRALHGPGRPENGLSAIQAAVNAGYGIEIDVQQSADGAAMVFHDSTLDRMTQGSGSIAEFTARDLQMLALQRGTDTIPTLQTVLRTIKGRVPLVIEIKDQDGALGSGVGRLETAIARDIDGYEGPLAVMSFNPSSVVAMRDLAPRTPRGLVTCAFDEDQWPNVSADARLQLQQMAQLEEAQAAFVSHDATDLQSRNLVRARTGGTAILCWTIRTQEDANLALQTADQITFEGFTPA